MAENQSAVLSELQRAMTSTSLTVDFFELVITRMHTLGYDVTSADVWQIAFAISKVENHIKNACNLVIVPQQLYEIVCDMVCGELLSELKSMGKLTTESMASAVASVKLGDTSVNFDNNTSQHTFDDVIDYLIHGKEGDLVCFRTMRW